MEEENKDASSEKDILPVCDRDTDLPLMSNTNQVLASHYSMNLHCDIAETVFRGSILISFRPVVEGLDEVVLDCCDIVVSRVFLLVHHHRLGDQKTELEFEQTEWALCVKCKFPKLPATPCNTAVGNTDSPEQFCLEIRYETTPGTRSLHWRRDSDGVVCAYTPASAVNNRGLFPCQDVPGSMSTWDLTLTLPSDRCYGDHKVFCTGDTEGTQSSLDGLTVYKFSTAMVLPMSTFAVAVGRFAAVDVVSGDGLLPQIRIVGCRSDLARASAARAGPYAVAAVTAAVQVLGPPYPLPRLDIVIVSQYFSGLGLASPNMTFVSPSVFAGDQAFLIKVSHEICHAWFGILIGAKCWTEVWLSEGFATFLEDTVHHRASLLLVTAGGGRANNTTSRCSSHLTKLRAHTRYRALCAEAGYVSSDLQQLRPMKGHKLEDEQQQVTYVKHGLDPEAGLVQSHYLRGYFMLHHLMEKVGEDRFLHLVRDYFNKYKGELVDSTQFLAMFQQKFSGLISLDQVVAEWLDSPGLTHTCHQLDIHKVEDLSEYHDIVDVERDILEFDSRKGRTTKKKSQHLEPAVDLAHSEQLVILFDHLLCHKLTASTMKAIRERYESRILTNPDVYHLWCELVLLNRYKKCYQDVSKFLVSHQSMGVYLYSEMTASKSGTLYEMAEKIYQQTKVNLDPSMKAVIEQYF